MVERPNVACCYFTNFLLEHKHTHHLHIVSGFFQIVINQNPGEVVKEWSEPNVQSKWT